MFPSNANDPKQAKATPDAERVEKGSIWKSNKTGAQYPVTWVCKSGQSVILDGRRYMRTSTLRRDFVQITNAPKEQAAPAKPKAKTSKPKQEPASTPRQA